MSYNDYDPNHADENDSGYLSIKPGSGRSSDAAGKDGTYNNKGTESSSGYGGYNDSRGGYNQSRGGGGGYNDSRGGGGGHNDSRGSGGGYNDSRGGGGGHNESRGGYNDTRGGGGGYNDRNQGGGGGYNDRNQGGGGGYNDRNQGGGGGYNDRHQGGDKGQQGSGWFGESEPRPRYDRNAVSVGGTALPDERGGKPKSRDTIYVSGMGSDVTENKVAEFFGKIGIIKVDKNGKPKIWMYFDKATGLPKGDCTITYEDESTCTNALEWFNNTSFLGKTIAVTRADFYDWEAKKNAGGGRGGRGGRGGGGRGRY